MPRPAGRRLKVFQARIGFYETVVAAPSQAAALRAWGVHQNLFENGDAKVVADDAVAAAALKHPETPLRRAVVSEGPFELDPAFPPKVASGPKGVTRQSARALAARKALDAAETALRQLDKERKREEADFQRRQEALDAEKDLARSHYVEVHETATSALARTRQRYQKARGKN